MEGIGDFLSDFLDYTLFTAYGTPVTVASILVFILLLTSFTVLAVFVRRLINRRLLARFDLDEGTRYTLSRLFYYLTLAIGIVISLEFIGIDLSSIAVVLGAFSVGIGFGLQNITNNFISGLIILFERPISVGDRIEVNDLWGDIEEINIRSTTVRTRNNFYIIVPNTEFVSEKVINYSRGDPRFRVDISVGVASDSDLDTVKKAFQEVIGGNTYLLKDPEPQIHLREFRDYDWLMQLRVWISDAKDLPRVRNELNQAIVGSFRKYDVQMPFPQRDLHLRSSVKLSIGDDSNKSD